MVQQLFKPVAALSHFRDYGISGGNPAPLFYAVFCFLPVSLHFCVYLKMALWIYFISALEPIIMTDIIWARKSLCVYKSCKIQDWVCRCCFSHTLHSCALTQFWMKKLYHGCTTNWMSWHLILFTFCFMYPGYHPICMFSNLIPGLHYCLLTSKWLPDADSSCQLSVNNAGIFTM